MMWLTAGALVIALVMTLGLLLLILVRGLGTFWPAPLARFEMADGSVHVGEVTRRDRYQPAASAIDSLPAAAQEPARELLERQRGWSTRWLVRTGNFDVTGVHFAWVDDFALAGRSAPEWAVIFERLTWGRFYGEPVAFLVDGAGDRRGPGGRLEGVRAAPPGRGGLARRAQAAGTARHRRRQSPPGEGAAARARSRAGERRRPGRGQCVLDRGRRGQARVGAGEGGVRRGGGECGVCAGSAPGSTSCSARATATSSRMQLSDGSEVLVPLGQVVRGYPANRLGLLGKLGIYLSRWAEFLVADPREGEQRRRRLSGDLRHGGDDPPDVARRGPVRGDRRALPARVRPAGPPGVRPCGSRSTTWPACPASSSACSAWASSAT